MTYRQLLAVIREAKERDDELDTALEISYSLPLHERNSCDVRINSAEAALDEDIAEW